MCTVTIALRRPKNSRSLNNFMTVAVVIVCVTLCTAAELSALKVLLKKLKIPNIVKEFPTFMQDEISLLCSQECNSGLPEPDETVSFPPTLFLQIITRYNLITFSHLLLGLCCRNFFHIFPRKLCPLISILVSLP